MRHGRKRGTDLLQSCVHSIREYQNSYLLFTKLSIHLSISHSLCSAVHNYDSLCRRSSHSPIMLSILLVGRAGASLVYRARPSSRSRNFRSKRERGSSRCYDIHERIDCFVRTENDYISFKLLFLADSGGEEQGDGLLG